jgi:hypothetical protein
MRTAFYLFLTICFFACRSASSVNSPIPEEQFVDVLADVRLLESYYSMKYQVIDTSRGKMENYYQDVFSKHHITKDDFEKSYIAYEADPKRMMEIEDKVIEKLTTMQMKDSTSAAQFHP